jgi:hypothetical protein
MSETADFSAGTPTVERQMEILQSEYSRTLYAFGGTDAYLAHVSREMAGGAEEVPEGPEGRPFPFGSGGDYAVPAAERGDFTDHDQASLADILAGKTSDDEAVDERFPGLYERFDPRYNDKDYLKATEDLGNLTDTERKAFFAYAFERAAREQVAAAHAKAAANDGGPSDELAADRIHEPAPVDAVEVASVSEGTPNVGDRTTRAFKLVANGRHREPGAAGRIANRVRDGLSAAGEGLSRLRNRFRGNSEPTEDGESREPLHRRVRSAVRTVPLAAATRANQGLTDVTERIDRWRDRRADRLVVVTNDERRITPLQAAVGGVALGLLGVWAYNQLKYGGGSVHQVVAAAASRPRTTGAGANSDLNQFQPFHVGNQLHQEAVVQPPASSGSNPEPNLFQRLHVGNNLHHVAEATLPTHVDINGAQSPWNYFADQVGVGPAKAMPEIDKLVHEGQQIGLNLNLRKIPGTDASGGNLVELTYNGHTISTEYAARLLAEVQAAN